MSCFVDDSCFFSFLNITIAAAMWQSSYQSSRHADNMLAYPSVAFRPHTYSAPNSYHQPTRRQCTAPYEAIQAHTLREYTRNSNVLLIDVRPRMDFDLGHIDHENVICIEPIELRENTSAEELQERLIYSPPREVELFSRRDRFDYVVYYDEKTTDSSFLVGSPADCRSPHLRFLHDSLHDFSREKPLKEGRPPIFLVGGLEAWVRSMGPSALTASRTTMSTAQNGSRFETKMTPKQHTRNTLIRRHPTYNPNSNSEVRMKRLHDFKSLSEEESRVWAKKAREEELRSISPPHEDSPSPPAERAVDDITREVDSMRIVHSYDDFYHKKLEPSSNSKQSMTSASAAPKPQYQPYSPQVDLLKPLSHSLPPSLLPTTVPSSIRPHSASHLPPPPSHLPPPPPSRPLPAVPRTKYSGVSDVERIQAPLARQTSAHSAPVYAKRSAIDGLPLPRSGLPNLGNTCYMNSVIQCLSGTLPLSRFFVDDTYRQYLVDQDRNFRGSRGLLPGFYANLIRMLWRGDSDRRALLTFREFCGRIHPDFKSTRQQDAKEFFDILIDAMHEDFNAKRGFSKLPQITEEQQARRERLPLSQSSSIEWARYLHNDSSFITYLLAGQHASQLKCSACLATSTSFEAFYSISVEIPTSGATSLSQCLRSYCGEEPVEWRCEKCKDQPRPRPSTKRIVLSRAPRILVVHFKRFSTGYDGNTRKIHTPVDFPLTHFDLSQHMLANPSFTSPEGFAIPQSTSKTPHPSSSTSRSGEPGSDANSLAVTPPFIYNAYAVVRHIGSSPTSGHYVAMVRDTHANHVWRRFDDERVTDFIPSLTPGHRDYLQSPEAYIVFYERALSY